jgi:hypothetical protein|tara:strand:+ start:854 stop:1378 length:525 start_codon:yes stop_codon:yes gene_type:complete
MITKINTSIPTDTNKKILDILFNSPSVDWGFAIDDRFKMNLKKLDSGLSFLTYSQYQKHRPHEVLNTYASFIFDMTKEKSLIKFKEIDRFYWNWYHPYSKGTKFHIDETEDNCYSIIYNLHTNDGGTKFNINDEIKFEKSVESEAVIFPSKILHTGVAPTKDLHRFSLNIITRI